MGRSMYVFHVDLHEFDSQELANISDELRQREPQLLTRYPIQQVVVLGGDLSGTPVEKSDLQIYVAVEDCVGADEFRHFTQELSETIGFDVTPSGRKTPMSPTGGQIMAELVRL